MSKKNAGGAQPKLPGMPSLDGKLQLTTDTIVQLPVTIKNVHVNKLDDGKFRAILGDIQYTAKNADDALKGWKSAYKKSIVAKRTKKKKAQKADEKAVKEDAAKQEAATKAG
jgi:hypothetical protein